MPRSRNLTPLRGMSFPAESIVKFSLQGMNIGNIPKKIVRFLKEVRLEIKKVNWPTRKQTLRYTLIVLGVVIVMAIFLGTLDFVFTTLINKFAI